MKTNTETTKERKAVNALLGIDVTTALSAWLESISDELVSDERIADIVTYSVDSGMTEREVERYVEKEIDLFKDEMSRDLENWRLLAREDAEEACEQSSLSAQQFAEAAERIVNKLSSLSFLGRLRWLVTGRM